MSPQELRQEIDRVSRAHSQAQQAYDRYLGARVSAAGRLAKALGEAVPTDEDGIQSLLVRGRKEVERLRVVTESDLQALAVKVQALAQELGEA